jgi:hypothetical protein
MPTSREEEEIVELIQRRNAGQNHTLGMVEEEEIVELIQIQRNNSGQNHRIPFRISYSRVLLLIIVLVALVVEFVDVSFDYSNEMVEDRLSKLAETQIQHYRQGTGLIVAIHLTHHGGTTFCGTIGKAIGTDGSPSFACRVDKHFKAPDESFPDTNPWTREETAGSIRAIRQYFHFVTWEYYFKAPDPPLADTDWANPDLVSVIIMRDPISRLLAGDGWVAKDHPAVHGTNATEEEWWAFANDTKKGHTNNFALHILAGDPCCNGKDSDPKYLKSAKALVNRFSVVLDMECLDQGIQALADLLGIEPHRNPKLKLLKRDHPPNEERIPYPNVYKYLLERNKLDIELYQWSKRQSLVDCSALRDPTPAESPTASPPVASPVKALTNDKMVVEVEDDKLG